MRVSLFLLTFAIKEMMYENQNQTQQLDAPCLWQFVVHSFARSSVSSFMPAGGLEDGVGAAGHGVGRGDLWFLFWLATYRGASSRLPFAALAGLVRWL